MTKEELEKEAEANYCKGCKLRIEQCLWAWRKVNGLNKPYEKNCSCKEVPAYLAGAEPREKRIEELEEKNRDSLTKAYYQVAELEKEKCELLGIIQGKDKAIEELKDDNMVMAKNYSKMEQKFDSNISKAKELLKQYLKYCGGTWDIPVELEEQTEQFLKDSEVEK